jgi:hypothetical protein
VIGDLAAFVGLGVLEEGKIQKSLPSYSIVGQCVVESSYHQAAPNVRAAEACPRPRTGCADHLANLAGGVKLRLAIITPTPGYCGRCH